MPYGKPAYACATVVFAHGGQSTLRTQPTTSPCKHCTASLVLHLIENQTPSSGTPTRAVLQATDGDPPAMRVDALVASGNALATAADLASSPEAALRLLHDAGEAYAAALARDEDAGTLSNMADAWVAAARRLVEAGRRDEAGDLCRRAMAAYQRSCELSSSEEGDDLPGAGVMPRPSAPHATIAILTRMLDLCVGSIQYSPCSAVQSG